MSEEKGLSAGKGGNLAPGMDGGGLLSQGAGGPPTLGQCRAEGGFVRLGGAG